ncbi:MAG: 30S ribosomal protein S20 [Thermoanaerobaculia bacterium]|nr:30S ribosomal protein S20 [Thermoanaerobaculia bacterium]
MANHKSAEKRIRQTAKRRLRNRQKMTRMRSAIKKLRAAVAEGDQKTAQELLQPTLSIVDRTAQKGVIHGNKAARTKSRLVYAVSSLG